MCASKVARSYSSLVVLMNDLAVVCRFTIVYSVCSMFSCWWAWVTLSMHLRIQSWFCFPVFFSLKLVETFIRPSRIFSLFEKRGAAVVIGSNLWLSFSAGISTFSPRLRTETAAGWVRASLSTRWFIVARVWRSSRSAGMEGRRRWSPLPLKRLPCSMKTWSLGSELCFSSRERPRRAQNMLTWVFS